MAAAQEAQWSDALCKAIAESKISGDFRLYNYSRIHNGGGPDTDSSLAAGGDIFLQTGSLAGFSTFWGFYTANYIPTDLPVNETLVGKDHYLHALAQAYLQYYRNDVLVRGGWQVLDTPFARDDMYTMLPRAFGGVSVGIEPLALLNAYPVECLKGQKTNPPKAEDFQTSPDQYPHIILFGARMFQYESRFEDQFTRSNDYNLPNTDGFLTAGLRYFQSFGSHFVNFQAWYYQFYDFAQLGYFEAKYQSSDKTSIHPIIGVQYLIEGNSGERRLGSVQSEVYGAMAGITFPRGALSLVFDWSPEHFDSFRHGGLIHPYNDLSGTIYTDSMNNGIEDLGPGYAYGIKGEYRFLDDSLTLSMAYVRYKVKFGFGGAAYAIDGPFGFPKGTPVADQSQWELDPGISYRFKKGILKDLIIQNNVGIRDFTGSPFGAYIENRFAMIYSF